MPSQQLPSPKNPVKWLILCREPRLYSCKRLKQAANLQGIEVDILDPNRFLLKLENGKFQTYYQQEGGELPELLPEYQAVLPRFGTASTETGCRVLTHYELQGVASLNTVSAFSLARDKWQSLQVLNAHNLPLPNTMFAGDLFPLPHSLSDSPVVIKTLSGSQGVGVILSESKSGAGSIWETFREARIPSLVQQFISEAKGRDIRAFVIGDRVVASMVRIAKGEEFRANIHQGGSAESCTLSAAEQVLAVKATQVLGLDVAGVDLIQTDKGLMILEVNASPGLEMIEQISKEPIAEQMIAFLLQKLTR